MRLAIVPALLFWGCFSPDLSTKSCSDNRGCPADYFCDPTRVSEIAGASLCSPLNGQAEVQPDLDPRTLFETRTKPLLVQSCSPCHSIAQGSVTAFLAAGTEYQALTSYKMGAFVNVPTASQSLLLQKGAHTGPALSPDEYSAVQSWLEAEIAFRPSHMAGQTKSSLLPTAPIITGDFTMNFGSEDPINDPQATLSFHLEPAANKLYWVSQLQLTAGPTTGIHIGHPRFYFISAAASFADPADSLATVDQVAAAGATITVGGGTLLLTNAPSNDPNTRIGVAFQVLERSSFVDTTIACKDFKDFSPALVSDLVGCAGACHAPGKNNSAATAFDMSAATSTDRTVLGQFCVQALGRISTATPNKSILLVQALPEVMGGTPNHPFKFATPADITRFTNEVLTWAAGEK